MKNGKVDLFGIGKRFRIEFLDSKTYDNAVEEIENGNHKSISVEGTLIMAGDTQYGQLFVKDGDNCMNIIPISRIISMIHIKEQSETEYNVENHNVIEEYNDVEI